MPVNHLLSPFTSCHITTIRFDMKEQGLHNLQWCLKEP